MLCKALDNLNRETARGQAGMVCSCKSSQTMHTTRLTRVWTQYAHAKCTNVRAAQQVKLLNYVHTMTQKRRPRSHGETLTHEQSCWLTWRSRYHELDQFASCTFPFMTLMSTVQHLHSEAHLFAIAE